MRPPRLDTLSTMIWVRALALAGAATFVALCAWVLYDGYRETRARGLAASTNIALLMEQDIGRMFELFDLSLFGVVEGLKRRDIWTMAPDVRDAVLFDNASNASFLSTILVLDDRGDVVLGSRQQVGPYPNLADRDYFEIHRDNRDAGLFVGKPIISRAGPRGWVLPISRRIDRPDGGFGGVVRASVSLDFFTSILQNLDLGAHGEAALFKTDGAVVMRQPFRLMEIGTDASGLEVFKQFARARRGQFEGVSRTDGAERLYSYRQIRNLPLMVLVGTGAADLFATWRDHASILSIAMGALLAGGAALVLLLRRELKQREQAEANARVSEARLAETALKLAVFAYQDGLTGLSNRRNFDERLEEETARTRRTGEPLSLLLIDVDFFKHFNDTQGHLAGDEALRRIAQCVQQSLKRPADLAARFGGEEVAVLLPSTSLGGAVCVGERIRGLVEHLAIAHPMGCAGKVTVSIGIAEYDTEQADAAGLIARADEALYRSKHQGRNRVEASTHRIEDQAAA